MRRTLGGFLQTGRFNALAHVEWGKPMVDTLRNRLVDKWGESINDSKRKVILFDIQKTDELINGFWSDESETSFVFMDGIAVQIASLESRVPVSLPIILTYPHKKDVSNSVRMRDEIEDYRGHSWDDDYYSIALLYGKERRLKKYYN